LPGLVARVGLLAPQWYVTLVTFEGVSQLIALEGHVGRLVSLVWYQITRVHCVSRDTRHAWRAWTREVRDGSHGASTPSSHATGACAVPREACPGRAVGAFVWSRVCGDCLCQGS
jgi:hypothetical protein